MAMLGVQSKEKELRPYQEENRYSDAAQDTGGVNKSVAPRKIRILC
jgi:hypothetical protein